MSNDPSFSSKNPLISPTSPLPSKQIADNISPSTELLPISVTCSTIVSQCSPEVDTDRSNLIKTNNQPIDANQIDLKTNSVISTQPNSKQQSSSLERLNQTNQAYQNLDSNRANVQSTCYGSNQFLSTTPEMNGLSLSEVCYLFCCPPCPGNIAAKVAFQPPEPSYVFVPIRSDLNLTNKKTVSPSSSSDSESQPTAGSSQADTEPSTVDMAETVKAGPEAKETTPANKTNENGSVATTNGLNKGKETRCGSVFTACKRSPLSDIFMPAKMELSERAEWQYTEREMRQFEAGWARSSRGNRIACVYVRAVPQPKYVILFSHGNAVDIGQMSSFYYGLGTKINCDVFGYDYSGYGMSSGRSSERNLYADVECAFHILRTKFNVPAEKIILYGQSIGTVPTVDLASKYDVAAVILHSPLLSGMRVAFPQTKRTWFFDAFPSIDKISKVNSLVLVIHGTDDEVIDISHGVEIYERCPRAAEPLWVEGAGHNDVELYTQYLERLRQLITVELAN